MNGETKLKEWRPEDCGTRIGDIVRTTEGLLLLKVKCRRCSKRDGVDIFHFAQLSETMYDPTFSPPSGDPE